MAARPNISRWTYLSWRFLACCCLSSLTAQAAGAQQAAVLSSAGGLSGTASDTLFSVAGQPSPAGRMQDGTLTLSSGLFAVAPHASTAFAVTHAPPRTHPRHQEITVTLGVRSKAPVRNAELHYRRGGDAAFTARPMSMVKKDFQGSIPAEAVTEAGVAYYMTATNARGVTARTPLSGFYAVQVDVPAPGLTPTFPLPGGTGPSAYRIVSLPLDLAEKDPAAVLADDLGPYDDTQWRLFALQPDQTNAELPEVDAIEPGRGYWLITREGAKEIDTGPGQSNPLDRPYGIPLHPAWNLIGNPFSFPVSTDQAEMKSGRAVAFRSFDGSWNDPIGARVRTLEPFAGYALFNPSDTIDTLFVDPRLPAGGPAGKTGPVEPVWAIRIQAQSGTARDADNIAAVIPGASLQQDALDFPEPPSVEDKDYVSVYFPHPEWNVRTEKFSTDVRAPEAAGAVWHFEVAAGGEAPVTLTFDGVSEVSEGDQVWLLDAHLQVAQDLRADSRYTLAGSPRSARPFELIVGAPDFIAEHLRSTRALPAAFELKGVFPNPFSASTTIQYSLPRPEQVVVKVYNLLGEEVAVLTQETQQAEGHHAVVWDGHSALGRQAASGVYLVHVQAGRSSATQKVVFVR